MAVSPQKFTRRELLQARVAVSIAFFLLGFGAGLWAVHIPVVQQRLGIDPAVLGLVLLALAIGAMAAMPTAGLAVAKFGSRRTTALATLAFTLAMPLPMVAGTVALLFVAAAIFGFCLGGLDVGSSHENVTFDSSAFNNLKTTGAAGLVQNTWRELPAGTP